MLPPLPPPQERLHLLAFPHAVPGRDPLGRRYASRAPWDGFGPAPMPGPKSAEVTEGFKKRGEKAAWVVVEGDAGADAGATTLKNTVASGYGGLVSRLSGCWCGWVGRGSLRSSSQWVKERDLG